jgi:SAM-dependent methyltransferase
MTPLEKHLLTLLGTFASRDGIYLISEPRSFQHPEEAYDQQYGNDSISVDAFRKEGERLLDFFEEYGFRDSAPVLEIGCGTGRLSIPLALSGRIKELLFTDPSPAFCSIASRKMTALDARLPRVSFAVLLSEDLDRLPRDVFSLVIMRSVLHHIADIPQFFRDVGKILVPGGLVVFEEPCQEGYLLMGAMTQMVPDMLRGKGVTLSARHEELICHFVNTIQFYARRDIDKSQAEDKHLFRPEELIYLGGLNQIDVRFFPNRTLAGIDRRSEHLPLNYFECFYFDYLKYCMSWDSDLLKLFAEHVRPYFQYFECLALHEALPHTYGTFLCRKRA